MKKRIGCLHAHYSNIPYIEQALSVYGAELLHFVDPALVYRISSDKTFSQVDAQQKVNEQLEWIAKANVDAILITCTNYIALLQEDQQTVTIPVIKIDEPLFEHLCKQAQPQLLLFTNPATVEGTMRRLHEYAQKIGKHPVVEALVIDNSFELIMQGKQEQYLTVVSDYMRSLLRTMSNNISISVAQLSMVDAARIVQSEMNIAIGNPLEALTSYMENVQTERR
ncbi:aspartate/glutamate racemase family protein [Cohnella abietis]|uniref:Asp/Glu/hydantoin racemase n=1 Tax=Cohnella abietis TaxID=2507935 RepID=A0A3T1DE95_9BACL|nr:aspartate/glutamate racemase family protein [Cohnella abietis]BBI36413.1 hypothetical protein KCTCHS21_58120 [Cohnella abietis]